MNPDPSFDSAAEPHVDAEAATFGEAVQDAADQLGLEPAELAIEILDPGRSAESSAGYRSVKIRARRRPADAPDGARAARQSGMGRSDRGDSGYGGRREREPRRHMDAGSYGPPPPPMDPAKITPEIVEMVRGLANGVIEHMNFPGSVTAEKTSHGIRIALDTGELDQFLIGKDGETLSAFQHLLGRMIRAKMPQESPPRVEVDVAGFRDRQIENLKQLARELMEQARESGEEVTTDPLPASERRIVHLEVAESKGMETVTIGDGFFKRVVIRRAIEKPE
ncbi:MAG: protein jag [Candidatus Eiseniibacteriota bacterium]